MRNGRFSLLQDRLHVLHSRLGCSWLRGYVQACIHLDSCQKFVYTNYSCPLSTCVSYELKLLKRDLYHWNRNVNAIRMVLKLCKNNLISTSNYDVCKFPPFCKTFWSRGLPFLKSQKTLHLSLGFLSMGLTTYQYRSCAHNGRVSGEVFSSLTSL